MQTTLTSHGAALDIHLARMELANFSVRADVIDTRPQVLLLASQHR